MPYRVGTAFDAHRFSADPVRRLVLGGVELSSEGGLDGHSDADVVAHAVADAMLGAAALGSLGERFPDSDPTWQGADSVALLAEVRSIVESAGWRVVNADCSVVLDDPVLAPHRGPMERRLSEAAGGPVSVKAKRAEGLGALGRREGVACWAAVLLEPASPGQ